MDIAEFERAAELNRAAAECIEDLEAQLASAEARVADSSVRISELEGALAESRAERVVWALYDAAQSRSEVAELKARISGITGSSGRSLAELDDAAGHPGSTQGRLAAIRAQLVSLAAELQGMTPEVRADGAAELHECMLAAQRVLDLFCSGVDEVVAGGPPRTRPGHPQTLEEQVGSLTIEGRVVDDALST